MCCSNDKRKWWWSKFNVRKTDAADTKDEEIFTKTKKNDGLKKSCTSETGWAEEYINKTRKAGLLNGFYFYRNDLKDREVKQLDLAGKGRCGHKTGKDR